jgi:hypothetical protein
MKKVKVLVMFVGVVMLTLVAGIGGACAERKVTR